MGRVVDRPIFYFYNFMAAPKLSLKARALRYLSIREHSRLELARKLARHAQEGEDVQALLDTLEKANWLSQERFSESLIHRRAARFGNSRIVAELQSHGIAGEALTEIKADLAQDETARACEVWRRKFGSRAESPEQRVKQMRFLLQRGFSQRAAQVALRGLPDDVEPEAGERTQSSYVERDSDDLTDFSDDS
jgi:regulatory protein